MPLLLLATPLPGWQDATRTPGRFTMIIIRRAAQRGHAHHGWLDTRHVFSFADYYDPEWMGWGNLRVINEDRIAPRTGFGRHGHRDMEILSYVLEGALSHQDSMGNGTTIVPGQIQRMTAGTGVLHSEQNADAAATTHFLQIWLLPDALGLTPGYAQQETGIAADSGHLCLLAAPVAQAPAGVLPLHADARLYAGLLDADAQAQVSLAQGRKACVFVARGQIEIDGQPLQAGDTALLEQEPEVLLSHGHQAEVLVFDLAAQ